MSHTPSEYRWVVVVAGFLVFTFAFGMGANDIPNAFGTTIASDTLTIKQAVVMAGVFELAGAYSMSGKVEEKIKQDVINPEEFESALDRARDPGSTHGSPGRALLMWGLTCALAASTVWVILVTWMGWPISSTQTIISSMMVLTFVLPDTLDAIYWHPIKHRKISPIYRIFLYWIVTPPAAALLSGVCFSALKWFVLQRHDSERQVLRFLPLVWALTTMNIALIVFFRFDFLGPGVSVLASVTTATFVYATAYQFGIPHARRRLERYNSSLRRRVDAEVLELHESFTGALEGGQRRTMGEEEPTWHRDADDLVVPSAAVPAAECRERLSGKEEGGGGGILQVIEEDGGHPQENGVDVHGQEREVTPAQALDLPLPGGNLAPDGPNVLEERRLRAGGHDAREEGEDEGIRGGHEARAEGEDEGRVWDAIVDAYCQVEMHSFGREVVFSEVTRTCQEPAQRFCPRVEAVFYPLQILPACALAFAHGTNDVANQLAPFSLIYGHSLTMFGKYGMITVVGIAMCLGFALMGCRVTRNIGGLTLMTPSRSVTCQVCAAFAVAMCSVGKMPVSTTQILIGSTIGVGAADNYRTVDWWLFGKFFLSWMATVLGAGGLTAIFFSSSIYSPSAL